ncbi:MAG: hypothetical protein OEM82_05015 [Acidobacteriota bacterium]|nr:hypothetical protein [Acidobacteriota bacterium]MDH3528887.1 hypothetical protein [Acidobacteriota bacterium]
MNKKVKFIAVLLLVSVALVLAGCPKRVSIADIESDPGRFADKKVAIAGIVTTSYGISIPFTKEAGGIYKIDDGTGSIWVYTDRSVPGKDAQLGVKGKVQRGFTYKGKNYGLVLIEDDRKFKKN